MRESDENIERKLIADEYWEKYHEIISRPSPSDGTIVLDSSARELKELKDLYLKKLNEIS